MLSDTKPFMLKKMALRPPQLLVSTSQQTCSKNRSQRGTFGLFDPTCRAWDFRPVSVDNLDEHDMHSEFYSLSEEAAQTLRDVKQAGGRVVAVGTTSIRTLETIGGKFQGDIQADSGWTNILLNQSTNSR